MSQAMNKPPMKTAAEALEHLLAQAKSSAEVEVVNTQDALGRILARDILSQVDVPPMNNTQMDGYAVRVADIQTTGQSFVVSQRIPAGHVGTELKSGTIARIFTGATIPPGADAVVMQEDCVVNGDQVTIQEVPKQGQWIRLQGEDFNRVSNRQTMEEVTKAIQEIINNKNGIRVVNNIVPSVKYSNSGRYFVNNRGVSVEE